MTFKTLKTQVASIIALKHSDIYKYIHIVCDASHIGLETVLVPKVGDLSVLSPGFKCGREMERCYWINELEKLAVV